MMTFRRARRDGERPRRTLFAAALPSLAVLFACALPAVAEAHPSLVQASPAAGALTQRPPAQAELAFSEPVRLRGSAIEIRDPRGRRVATGPLRVRGAGVLRVDMRRRLAPGIFTVRWAALGLDGHAVGGHFAFGVPRADGSAPAGIERLGAPGSQGQQDVRGERALRVILRWVGLLAAALLTGGAALFARLRAAGHAPRGAADPAWERLVLAALGLGALAGTGDAVAAAAAGAGPPSLAALASGDGVLAVARTVLFVAGAIAVLRLGGRRGSTALGVAGAGALVTQALDGHLLGLQDGRVLAAIAGVAHVVAAGLWVGGLLVLTVLVGRGTVTPRSAVRAFAPLAAGSTGVLALTGVIAAVREVGDDWFLRWSDYGRVVVVKGALLVALAALGALATRAIRRGDDGSRLLRLEGAGAIAVLLGAAALAGLVPGRGQPLPAQRGNLLGGAALATATTGRDLVRLTVAPARPGPNHVIATLAALQPGRAPSSPLVIRVLLRCACARQPVGAVLRRGAAGVWRARVRLPATGTWLATVRTATGKAPPVALAVGDGDQPAGAAPLEVVQTADLGGGDAGRCRAYVQGLALAIGRLNASGGVDGHKVALRVEDDAGRPARAGALARAAASRGAVALAAPCGQGAVGALRAAPQLPALVADPAVGVVARGRLWRLAGDPHAEGEAIGGYLARDGVRATPGGPRRVVALVAGRHDSAVAARIAGLRHVLRPAGIALRLHVLPRSRAKAVTAARTALDARAALAVVLDGDEDVLFRTLRAASTGTLLPPAIIASSALLDEDFQLASGPLGRQGAIRSPTEVSPDTRDALAYAVTVSAIFPGDRPRIAGLRGFVAGLALAEALRDGASPQHIAARLHRPRRFTDALVAPWRDDAPAAGGIRFGLLAPRFLPANLIPVRDGGESFAGRWFLDGAWTRPTADVFGPPL